MEGFKLLLTVIFIIVCIALTIIVLLQEGKQAGLGAISGAAETYWGKNKGRSIEGKLEKGTRYLVIAFLVITVFLNIPFASSKAADATATTTPSTNVQQSTATGTSVSGTSTGTVSGTSAQ